MIIIQEGHSMSHHFRILPATASHAEQACHVLKRSITEVCVKDHRHNEAILQSWLSNKTPENIQTWIENPNNYTIVVEVESKGVIGISMLSIQGEILLNYLLPEYISHGIGKKMLSEMEFYAKKNDIKEIRVMSTFTACEFYKRNGFSQTDSGDEHCIALLKIII